jgi:hypothetical protein
MACACNPPYACGSVRESVQLLVRVLVRLCSLEELRARHRAQMPATTRTPVAMNV